MDRSGAGDLFGGMSSWCLQGGFHTVYPSEHAYGSSWTRGKGHWRQYSGVSRTRRVKTSSRPATMAKTAMALPGAETEAKS